MNNEQTPLYIEGIDESLYAGFWARLGSLLLDFIFTLPVTALISYLNGLGTSMFYYTLFPNLIFIYWYQVYLFQKYGGTPGKLVLGIKAICIDGRSVGWKEAVLRELVSLILILLHTAMMIFTLSHADEELFTGLSWSQQNHYLNTLSPLFFTFYIWISNIWFWSELIVLLTNKRKRAIHDYIAGTVIVKKEYIGKIREVMGVEEEES